MVDSFCAITRVRLSRATPAGSDSRMRTGLIGQSCAVLRVDANAGNMIRLAARAHRQRRWMRQYECTVVCIPLLLPTDRPGRRPQSREAPIVDRHFGWSVALRSTLPHEVAVSPSAGGRCTRIDVSEFVTDEIGGALAIGPILIWPRTDFIVKGKGLCLLVDRIRAEGGKNPLRHRLVFLRR